MGTIRIEYLPVQKYGLGLFGLDHLQLTYQDETDLLGSQDYWYVLEGVVDGSGLSGGTLGVLGTDGTTWLSSANLASREALVAKIGTPEQRGSRPVLTSGSAHGQWTSMADYGAEIDVQGFPYIGAAWPYSPVPTINSNSVIATLLWSIGLNINEHMPYGVRNAPGISTLLGTTKDDELRSAGVFTQVLGGEGQDTIYGSVNLIWIEKLYGGLNDDWIKWSKGDNIIHGGQPGTRYADDGLDTIDYSGVGEVHITATGHAVEHKTATYISYFKGGSDQMFSIEQVAWDRSNDTVTTGEGVDILEKPLLLDMKNNGSGRGDSFGMNDGDTPLIIIADGELTSIQTVAHQGLDAGFWVRSAEWLQGSGADDKIYTGTETLGVEAGGGDDLIDGRQTIAFSGQSPLGYDIEAYGQDGADIIVSGAGRTYANGGAGSDSFVLSAMTGSAGAIEFVIDGADASDKLYVPHDFFKIARGDFDGSQLFQLSGAPFAFDNNNPQTYFAWGAPGLDEVHGNIEFVGLVAYGMDGTDLIVSIDQGIAEEYTEDYGPGEPPGDTHLLSVAENNTLTIVRVRDWSQGVLGINFPLTFDNDVFAEAGSIGDYPGWMDAVNDATSGSRFMAPLDARPDAHVPLEFSEPTTVASARMMAAAPRTTGTAGDDVLFAATGGPYHFYGLAGRDDITGTRGGDSLDGGTGADILRGERGNDTYYVDSSADRVIEGAGGGFDRVISSVNYQLGTFVEHVALTGGALTATGNELRNTLEGNGLANTLTGGAGDDTLAGNGGNDILIGGAGGDGYVYETGDGRDIIIDSPETSGDGNVIVLAGTITAADVSFVRTPTALADLVLSFSDGGSLTVKNYFIPSGPSINGIEFATGETWSATEIAARAAAASRTANSAPVAEDDSFVYTLPGRFELPVSVFLGNDQDPDRNALTIASVSAVTGGTVALGTGGKLVLTPNGSSAIAFDYAVSDGHGGRDIAHAEIALLNNHAPTITAQRLAPVREDVATAGRLVAADADGDTLAYAVKAGAGPLKGHVRFGAGGQFIYTPNTNANGADHFTLTVTDGLSAPIERRFDFKIAAVNDAPQAKADAGFTVLSGETLILKASALLANDRDIDGDVLTIASAGTASGGTVSKTASGDIAFKAGSAGAASFSYTLSDGHGGSATAKVSLSVKPAPATHDFIGTEHRDTLRGTAGADVFIGKGGNDVLTGGAGNDVFKVFGDAGLDSIDGGAGRDTILGGRGNDIIRIDARGANFKNLETIDGGAGFDRIVATSGNDNLDFSKIKLQGIETIDLGAGKDIVRGSAGRDVFSGGAGNDTFVFRPGGGYDTVLDFKPGNYLTGHRDQLDLRGNGITGIFDLFGRMDQVGHDTVITLDASTQVRLKDVSMWSLVFDKFYVL